MEKRAKNEKINNMKARDLRIGNYVLYQDENIMTVSGILEDELHTNENGYKPIDEFTPIPLTEEWLLKFEQIYLINNSSSRYSYRVGYYSFGNLYISKDFELCTEDYNCNDMPGLGVTIEYVNQLQNLFHALEDEELKLKAI